jgi:ubiquinone/menaquinone biosynthesis C-methylase UbiE
LTGHQNPEEQSRRSRDYSDRRAPVYDMSNRFAAWVRGASDAKERRKAVHRLRLEPGQHALEVSCGTGTNLPLIRDRIGYEGRVVGLDISGGMLQRCRKKVRGRTARPDLVLGDASLLPFRDASFDAVLHHGGLAEFPDKRGALAEMARVVKSGAKVVVCDAGLPADRPARWINRLLLKLQTEYAAPPPIELLPAQARDVRVSWFRGDGWYMIEFVKALVNDSVVRSVEA